MVTQSTPAAQTKPTSRKQMKAAIRAKSYSDRRAWWSEQMRLRTLPREECEAEMRSIDKKLAKVAKEVPGEAWNDDVRMIRPARFDRELGEWSEAGGDWPPADMPPPVEGQPSPSRYDLTEMIRAWGERRYYPPTYIATSGHSYDVWMQDVYAGGMQHLLPEDPDSPSEATPERDCTKDGYLGSVVTIYQLQDRDQRRIRSREAAIQGRGKYRTMTGIL